MKKFQITVLAIFCSIFFCLWEKKEDLDLVGFDYVIIA